MILFCFLFYVFLVQKEQKQYNKPFSSVYLELPFYSQALLMKFCLTTDIIINLMPIVFAIKTVLTSVSRASEGNVSTFRFSLGNEHLRKLCIILFGVEFDIIKFDYSLLCLLSIWIATGMLS